MSSKSGARGGSGQAGGSGGGLADLRARLEPVVADAVSAAGFDLDALEVAHLGRKRQVKVIVDHDHGVGLDEVADISRAVSAELDRREDLLEGSYTLEVTSPGVSRPLTTPRHWRRARSRQVKARFTDGSQATVRVGDAGDAEVLLLFGGKEARSVAYSGIEHAVVEVEFRQPPPAELDLLGIESGGQNSGGQKEEGSK